MLSPPRALRNIDPILYQTEEKGQTESERSTAIHDEVVAFTCGTGNSICTSSRSFWKNVYLPQTNKHSSRKAEPNKT
ncbi:hypothetical protein OJAV_G00158940 [Oryzias javanicus]|uniref:Uncharacterized protein n=1 Tax=Oryzias javanicus TaxID=123683 RepID=A0A437CIU5_ORYJA|nr:hypothetical protein OJAV_G00158940 [Oryzias javanicus]